MASLIKRVKIETHWTESNSVNPNWFFLQKAYVLNAEAFHYKRMFIKYVSNAYIKTTAGYILIPGTWKNIFTFYYRN